ncbi:MAG TPA: hypothetical protein VGH38_35320 [Bryobacteraceae bacterium]|jgi:hypothetical protein
MALALRLRTSGGVTLRAAPKAKPHFEREKSKITCLTCKLKKCVGNCRFAVVKRPQ